MWSTSETVVIVDTLTDVNILVETMVCVTVEVSVGVSEALIPDS